ncbi:uncharacterized protein LOC134655680 [Cydia amplana]|uniref:uncharacterized protein LOC134655680 n=1 Tax=Cydia amplana TaxID=1869771 RepID=UPI002FE5DF98
MRRTYCAVFIIKCFLINFCLGELSIEKKDQVLNGFIDSLNNLPDQLYTYEEGVLLEAEKTNDNTYKVCARLKVSDIHNVDSIKIMRCRAELVQNEDDVLVVQQGHDCVEEQDSGTTQDVETGVSSEDRTTESAGYDGPVKLYNEVQQPNAEVTSGEQFVAIPRASPSVPCIGCASHVDPTAAGVPELANLGIRHLDLHDPAKHALRSVVDVERQVQVVNGVRYILTLLVDYDNCTAPDAVPCPVSIPCKISILEKPWKKLPDGSKYRAILANNCTAEWLFGDEGEVLPVLENNENNEIHPDPNADPDALKVIHNFDAQARPNQENSNADEVLKKIEDQIIPLSEFEASGHRIEATSTEKIAPPQEAAEQIHAEEIQRNYNENAAVGQQFQTSETNSLLSEDKKKAVDDLMHYFELDGFEKPEVTGDHHRKKRSYDELQNVNNPLNNVIYIQKLARLMVDYLNKVDMAIQNRVLTDVIRAEDEFANNQHFFYLQASVSIPCNKSLCNNKDIVKEVCTGAVETTDEHDPRILNAFCYEDENHYSKEELLSVADPILVEQVQPALEKIESESPKANAIKLIKILDATTKKMSGTLTRITLSLKYTNCMKSQAFYNRVNCSIIEDMGSKICQVEIHEIHNNMQIEYECIERSVRDDFSDLEQVVRKTGNVDPEIRNMVQQALKSLKHKTDANRKLKVVDVKSVSTKLMAGLLTKVVFSIGYTNCLEDKNVDDTTCELLLNTPIRECEAQVWDRPWQADSRQIHVKCEEDTDIHTDIEKNEIPVLRKKRTNFVGGVIEKNPNDPLYKELADESIKQHLASTINGLQVSVKDLKVKRVVTQVVAGTLTKIDFDVIPADGEIFSCHSEVWERPWLKSKEITVTCPKNQRRKRDLNLKGGMKNQDPEDPKYRKLAQESLDKYRTTLVGGQLNVKEFKVTKVTTQVVSGTKTFIDFTVFPTNGDEITCHSEIWEQSWLNKKDIDVNCGVNQQQNRAKRGLPGGHKEQNTEDPKYRKLAQESLDKYRTNLVGGQLNVKEFKVTKVTTQVVSGTKTFIDFTVFPTNGDEITCHSEIWEQPWLNKKVIDVNCGLKGREKREIFHDNPDKYKQGSPNELDASEPQFKLLAVESLQKYVEMINSTVHHEVVEVKKAISKVVAGKLYEIDFTAVPTSCSIYEGNTENCIARNDTLLSCHAQVWARPWLKSNEIDVICKSDDTTVEEDGNLIEEDDDYQKKLTLHPRQEIYGKELKMLAQEVLETYERQFNSMYKHKIRSIGKSYEQISEGILTTIEFYASPTKCLTVDETNVDDCQIKQPEVVILCKSVVRERTWVYFKDIKVFCNNVNTTKSDIMAWEDETRNMEEKYADRHKRDIIRDDDDNYMDDEMKYYYANRALKHLNERSDSHNLQKMITIHSIDVSNQMGARMIRMYIETAMTFCVRHQLERVDLAQCDEMEGLPHKLCHVRLWPSDNDEMIIRHVVVVCDDDSDFSSVTGFEVSKLIVASLRKLEESPKVKFKLVHQGEPYVMPALSSRFPIKLNFVVLRTNCTKDVDVFKQRHLCFVDSTTPATSCESKIYLSPNSKDIKDIKAWCNPAHRERRDISFGPAKSNSEDAIIAQLVEASLEKLETSSLHKYKQRVLKINSYSTKITRGRETTIDFDVGYSSCLKYESIKNISNCEFLEHLPIRHCISHVFERLWVENGRNIEVVCEDDETPLESQMEFENADTANQIANEALKHIEAKYPNAKRLQVVRIFSLLKQTIAGIHYRLKMEVGVTDCPALSLKTDCKLVDGFENNKFCRVNVWIRPWTDHPPNFRVICDYQESETAEVYHKMQAEHLFANFLATYRPDYMDDYKEMSRRFKIFRANVRKVHELNVHERGSATYAITRFSDMTSEEFSSKYLGLKTSLKSENNIPMIKAEIPNIDLPQSFDWRDRGAVTEVKDQGQCGSCWAFSVTGNVEGQWKLTSGKLLSLSEQELVDCDKTDQGCNGGLMDNAYRAIEELGGLELETDYPYEGADDKCVFNKTLSRVQISGSVNISSNETQMAQWLVANGPISIGINANAMQFYVGGVSHPWKALCSPKNLDHGVLIVGFGIKEYPLFHKHLPYWTVKNSWGKSWGEQGYYRVYRGDGTCGVNQMASSAVV